MNTCIVDGCAKPSIARGWCHMHYQRWRTHGDPLVVLIERSVRTPYVPRIGHVADRPRRCGSCKAPVHVTVDDAVIDDRTRVVHRCAA